MLILTVKCNITNPFPLVLTSAYSGFILKPEVDRDTLLGIRKNIVRAAITMHAITATATFDFLKTRNKDGQFTKYF